VAVRAGRVPHDHVRRHAAVGAFERFFQDQPGIGAQHGNEPASYERITRYDDGGGAKRSVQTRNVRPFAALSMARLNRQGLARPFDRFRAGAAVAKLLA
jgi:hypothetical protein